MKSKIILIFTAIFMLFSIQTEAKGWFKKLLGDVATGLGSAIVQQAAVQGGMSQQDAKQAVSNIVEGMGLNRESADVGMSWRDGTLNKDDKQSIVGNYVMDGIGDVTGQQELFNNMKRIKDAQWNRLSAQRDLLDEAKRNNTSVDRQKWQQAINREGQAMADVYFNAYKNAQERQKQRLQELLPIKQQLREQGFDYDDDFANEVAATIIGIQQSTELSEAEKESMLRNLGFNNYQEVSQSVEVVLSDDVSVSTNNLNAEAERLKAAEEAKRQAEQQRQEAERKATAERQNAIQQIETAKINGYTFDETALSPSQKSELDRIADKLNRYPDIKVLIIGNTCEIGYKNINLKKGLQRAEAGKEYLIEKGIAAERISVDSRGETQPLVPNTSSENRKQNRRIEFVIE